MDTSVAAVTVKFVVPEIVPDAALIVVTPTATVVASPLGPVRLLKVAIDSCKELHVTDDVIFCVVLSEKIPVAVNCGFIPRGLIGLTGVTAMDTSVAGVTVRFVVPNIPVAGSMTWIRMGPPTANEVASPLEPVALLMLATGVVIDGVVQVTDVVRTCVVASVYVPVAING